MLIAPKLNANAKSNWRVEAMPDRLPSLVLLVGFWIPPAIVGLVAADLVHRITTHVRPALIYALLTIFAVGYAAAWFLFQLDRIPPYVPGATNGSNVRTNRRLSRD